MEQTAEPFRIPVTTPPSGGIVHAIALMTTALTWPLLFVGGLVTTYRVGMAVPDWPTTFGINMFVYRFWTAPWGVYIEHTHRLLGTIAGLGCLILAAWSTVAAGRTAWKPAAIAILGASAGSAVLIASTSIAPFLIAIAMLGVAGSLLSLWYAIAVRSTFAALGWLALTGVILQGALGGYRVRMNSTDLAALHGCTGQAFFALMAAICVVNGGRWARHAPTGRAGARLRNAAIVTALFVYGQIVLGALLRHRSVGLAIHGTGAVVVLAAVVGLSLAALRNQDGGAVRPSARAALVLVVVQFALGIASWWVLRPFDGIARPVTRGQAIVRTAHQANGALLLAASVVLALRAARPLPANQPMTEPTEHATELEAANR